MSASMKDGPSLPTPSRQAAEGAVGNSSKGGGAYKGFVAGVFSGIAKLSVGFVSVLVCETMTWWLTRRQPSIRYDQSSVSVKTPSTEAMY